MRYLFFFLILIDCSEPFDQETGITIDHESPDHQCHDNEGNQNLCIYVAEEMPQYPGGLKELYKYISNNIQWPDPQGCMAGKVFVMFVVEEDGSLSQFEVVKGLGEKFDEAALKIFEGMPKWEPAKQNGQPVNARMMIPITFCP